MHANTLNITPMRITNDSSLYVYRHNIYVYIHVGPQPLSKLNTIIYTKSFRNQPLKHHLPRVCGTHGQSLQATPAAVTTTLDDFGINCELQYFSYSTKNSLTFSDPSVASSTTDDLVVLIVHVTSAACVLRSLWLWYAECHASLIMWRNAIDMTASRSLMQRRRTIPYHNARVTLDVSKM